MPWPSCYKPCRPALGIVSGRDLAQACGEAYSRPVSIALWILCEIAVTACDLAEVIGTVIGLNLLFGIAPIVGLVITGFDTFLFLAIQRLGIRKTEAFIVVLVGTIGVCFLVEILLARPGWGEVVQGLLPSFRARPPSRSPAARRLYVAIGIVGATVMPHNLYLHSALVQTRRIPPSREGYRQACRYNLIDSVVALNLAFFVNAAILVMAGATFYGHPEFWSKTGDIQLQDASSCCIACWERKWLPFYLPWRSRRRTELDPHGNIGRPGCDGGLFAFPHAPLDAAIGDATGRDRSRFVDDPDLRRQPDDEPAGGQPGGPQSAAPVCRDSPFAVHQ